MQIAKLSPEDKKSFSENGYLVLRKVFSDDNRRDFIATLLHLAQAQGALNTFVSSTTFNLDVNQQVNLLLECLMELENKDHAYISKIYDTVRETPALRNLINNSAICDAARELMELPENAPLYPQQCACRIDIPVNNPFALDWHQEVHYTFKDSEFVQLWAPAVHDINIENGALRILPGSHKVGVAETIDHIPEVGHAQFTPIPEIINQFTEDRVSLVFGDAILISNKLIHASGKNSSRLPRLTVLAHYHNPLKAGFFKNIRSHGTVQNPYKKEAATSA